MGTITIMLPDERLSRLEGRAAELGITVEELVRLSVDELLAKPDDTFEQALSRALDKHKDLYERLERHRGFGSAKGLIAVTDDFDAPLHDTDIEDSSAYARQLREQAQERGNIS
jgi:hypothetical protein